MAKRRRKSAAPRRRRRRNPAAAPKRHMATNARRRRSSPARRRARRNPPERGFRILGVTFPALPTIAFTTAGYLAPPFVEGLFRGFLPPEISANKFGQYAVKIGSVVGLGWVARQFVGASEGKAVMLGGAAYIAANLIQDFMPTLIPASTGYYSPGRGVSKYVGTGRYAGAGYQPNLGATRNITRAGVPSRLQPEGRY